MQIQTREAQINGFGTVNKEKEKKVATLPPQV